MNVLFPYLDTQNSQIMQNLFLISYFNLFFFFLLFSSVSSTVPFVPVLDLFRAFGTSGHFLHMFVFYMHQNTLMRQKDCTGGFHRKNKCATANTRTGCSDAKRLPSSHCMFML